MINQFLLPMLMDGGLGNVGGDTDIGFNIMKYKMLLSDSQPGEGLGQSEDQYMKLYMFVPVAKKMLHTIADKLTNMTEETKNKIVAAAIMKTLADNMLEDTPEDELALTLRDVADEIIMQFVFTNQTGSMIKEHHEKSKSNLGHGPSKSGSVGGKLLSERKIGEDPVKGILIEGKREEPQKAEDKSGIRKRASEARKNKKAQARKAGEGEAAVGERASPF